MSTRESENDDGSLSLSITVSAGRAAELVRLSADLNRDPVELAREYLEKEIEAEHGLSYGPWLRQYMYR